LGAGSISFETIFSDNRSTIGLSTHCTAQP
jgi:hypothetical protein